MPKTENEPVIMTRKDRRFLTCQLTEEEIRAAAEAMARYHDDKQELEEQITSIKAEFKAKIEQCEANIRAQKRLVRDKRETRPVDIEITSNFTDCTVTTTRLDTGEIIEDRKMTGDERQLRITDDDGPLDEE
jgi:hypothetical protein